MRVCSLVVLVALFFTAPFSLAAKGNTITVDLQSHQLNYYDGKAGIDVTYPIVSPKEDALNVYRNYNNFDIDLIELSPNWISSDGKKYPGNSPGNPMGVARIRFVSVREGFKRNCSIHGNARSIDLGRSLSNCCIRLMDEDIKELFFLIDYETIVKFKY